MFIKIITFGICILLTSCYVDKSEKNRSHVDIAEENGKKLIDHYFKKFNPKNISESNVARFSVLIYSIDELNNTDLASLNMNLSKNGWVLVNNQYGTFYCNKERTILEIVEPKKLKGKKIESLVATQEMDEWRVGYAYRIGGMDECLSN